jgi:hypothetical protein
MPKREDYSHETEDQRTHVTTIPPARYLKLLPNKPGEQKLCGKCNLPYPLTRQWWQIRVIRNYRGRGELRVTWNHLCIGCHRRDQRARARVYREKRTPEQKEAITERQTRWRKKNRKAIKEYNRRYYQLHKEEIGKQRRLRGRIGGRPPSNP